MTIASALTAMNTDIVNARTAITTKGGTVTSGGGSSQLATDIATIPTGSSPVITSLNVTPTTSAQTITAPSGTDGYSPVNVAAVTAAIDSNIQAGNIKKDVTILNVIGTYEGGSTPTGRYQLLDRVKTDSNVEIGTVCGFFTDANDVEYAVVCLDAQYRLASGQWCSSTGDITNLPLYNNQISRWWYDAKETATKNCDLILTSKTSTAISHCRSKSFVIGGVTYYGQLPSIKEMFDLWKNHSEIQSKDTSASSYTSLNFNTAHTFWTSTQYSSSSGYYLHAYGYISVTTKTTGYFVAPILEIPNAV